MSTRLLRVVGAAWNILTELLWSLFGLERSSGSVCPRFNCLIRYSGMFRACEEPQITEQPAQSADEEWPVAPPGLLTSPSTRPNWSHWSLLPTTTFSSLIRTEPNTRRRCEIEEKRLLHRHIQIIQEMSRTRLTGRHRSSTDLNVHTALHLSSKVNQKV